MPRPKPDDRSDNVEKLQEMVQNTIENIEKSRRKRCSLRRRRSRRRSVRKTAAAKKRSLRCARKSETKPLHGSTATSKRSSLMRGAASFFCLPLERADGRMVT
ncbi:Small, acid-soluble spore protein Tlp [Geobacillus sp. BCO2]|nr:Small, acid-soluble spore protein Tlp [Geobacillus sp. BCO2]